MAIVYRAPQDTNEHLNQGLRIFLAGSIDMGKAVDWQTRLENELAEYDVVICNPRRDNWDPTLTQSINNPQFNEQVTWELQNIESADLVVFYFDPAGPAPITLMELGLVAGLWKHAIVCCPEGYWRKGNVEIICDRYEIKLCDNIDDFITLIKEEI